MEKAPAIDYVNLSSGAWPLPEATYTTTRIATNVPAVTGTCCLFHPTIIQTSVPRNSTSDVPCIIPQAAPPPPPRQQVRMRVEASWPCLHRPLSMTCITVARGATAPYSRRSGNAALLFVDPRTRGMQPGGAGVPETCCEAASSRWPD